MLTFEEYQLYEMRKANHPKNNNTFKLNLII